MFTILDLPKTATFFDWPGIAKDLSYMLCWLDRANETKQNTTNLTFCLYILSNSNLTIAIISKLIREGSELELNA